MRENEDRLWPDDAAGLIDAVGLWALRSISLALSFERVPPALASADEARQVFAEILVRVAGQPQGQGQGAAQPQPSAAETIARVGREVLLWCAARATAGESPRSQAG